MHALLLLLSCAEPAVTDTTSPVDSAAPVDAAPADTASPSADWPALVINEFMASNQSGVTDETGQRADWIELYNPTDDAVSLAGWSMSDELEEPTAWPLDDTLSIPAGGYLLLWADGEPEEGPSHLGFQLAVAGEQLTLCAPDGTLLNALEFGVQAADLSAARVPDGSLTWVITDASTPGESNGEGR